MIAICCASDKRLPILEQNLAHMLTLGEVFLCLTDPKERDHLQKLFPKVNYCLAPNNPLGAKWQKVIDLARTKNPDYLITCGSDDFLSKDYVDNAVKLSHKGYEFIGVNFWILSNGKKHYEARYKYLQHFPAGSGRVFTSQALDKINYQIFDKNANRLLDDNVLQKVYDSKVKSYVSHEPYKDGLIILAAKGNWNQINPMEKFLNAPSIHIKEIKELPEQLPKVKF